MLVLHVLATNSQDLIENLASVTTPEQQARLHAAGAEILSVLAGVMLNLGAGFVKQLTREMESSRLEIYTPGQHRLAEEGGEVRIAKRFLREIIEAGSFRCLGCPGIEDCSLAQAKGLVHDAEVNPESEICVYRVDGEEFVLDEPDDWKLEDGHGQEETP
jgi:hypothetical protein